MHWLTGKVNHVGIDIAIDIIIYLNLNSIRACNIGGDRETSQLIQSVRVLLLWVKFLNKINMNTLFSRYIFHFFITVQKKSKSRITEH